ncbi:RNA polymerase subunit sigma-70 [Actinoplanes sp. TRM 88003]|uniref:RNA polymerase subunit sigma-70 n=1 Tax=Paractinoplanes aksuensis TaxID=2939490 RepID=A0ABT1DY24_9ACTN|nr:rod shape-determining protein MreC [Actinoplanes aksuensis]MCO8274825.1 RNA polymerase subunit sigma-70 [Actinoplanes aksuensis]
MPSPSEVREVLSELAEPVVPAEGYEDRIMRRARRIRGRRRIVSGAAAVVCVAVLATMFRFVAVGPAPELAAVAPDGPFLGWGAVGDVDPGLVQEATEVWDRAGPHTGVRTLVATRDVQLRSVVVLQGYDSRGLPRLAFFTSDQSAADALRLRADRPAPDPVRTRVVSLVSPRLTGPTGTVSTDGWGSFAIVVAMPGVFALRLLNTTIDVQMFGNPDGPTSRLAVQNLPLAGTAQTTTIAGFIKADRPLARATKVFEVPGEGGAIGDVRAVPAEVVGRADQQLTVAFPKDRPVRLGQLAVVTEGLVGRVTTVDAARGEATIDLVTSASFTGTVYSNISNVPGTVRGTGGKLVMEDLPADGDLYGTNRILMPDPSQPNDQVGAITIGRATTDKPANATTVELTPTADLAHLENLSIMTPPTD